jgi:hypothetical protein
MKSRISPFPYHGVPTTGIAAVDERSNQSGERFGWLNDDHLSFSSFSA